MQDRYAGDVGDFFKLALVNRLCAPAAGTGEQPLVASIVWYLVDDETHNNDGKHVGYLDPDSDAGRALRPVDPVVYDSLAGMVGAGRRSVADLESSGALAPGTISFAARLRLSDLSAHDRAGRLARRDEWLRQATAAVEACDVVTLDPDNGIRHDDHRVGRHRNGSEKHSYTTEIRHLLRDEQSLVAYQHADRSAPVDVQARRCQELLAECLGRRPLAAVRTSRGSARLFVVVPADRHRSRLARQLDRLATDPVTASEFTIYTADEAAGYTGHHT